MNWDWILGQRYTIRHRLDATSNEKVADAKLGFETAHTLNDVLGHLRAHSPTSVTIETRRHEMVEIFCESIVAAKPIPEPPERRRTQPHLASEPT